MAEKAAIKVQDVSKCYNIYSNPKDRLKQSLWGGKKQFYKQFWALKDISFTIEPGTAIGVIGRNGSGKSTLLQLICGTLTPSSGNIEVNGKVAALLELGAGFNPEFTGRENVYMNGAILGFSKKEIDKNYQQIAEFADIGDFIEQPVKSYSSGMFVRLAFAVQACFDPDILIVDEALAVGDIFFQQKCIARIKTLLQNGTTVIFVSHDMSAINNLCDATLWLNQGKLMFMGDTKIAVEKYTASYLGYSENQKNIAEISIINQKDINAALNLHTITEASMRYGNRKIVINKFGFMTHDHFPATNIKMGEKVKLILELESHDFNIAPNIGFQIKDKFGNIAMSTNTKMLKQNLAVMSRSDRSQCGFEIELMLGVGEYTITVAVSVAEAADPLSEIYDWIEQVTSFSIISPGDNEKQQFGFAYCPVNFIPHVN